MATAQSITLALARWLKFLFLSFNMQKSTISANFCNLEIPGLRCWRKRLGILGLQSLVKTPNQSTVNYVQEINYL